MPDISPSPEDKAKAKANDLKAKGNTAFGKKDFKTALGYYTQAINADPAEPIFLSNRAACHLQLKNWIAAETDCNLALVMIGQLADDNVPNAKAGVKLLYRRGVARRAQGKLTQAKMDWERALNLDPDNKSVKEDLNALAWELKKQDRNSRGMAKPSVTTTTPPAKTTIPPVTSAPAISAKRRSIPIQIVDSLPKDFVFTPPASGPGPEPPVSNLPTTSAPKPVPVAAPVVSQKSAQQVTDSTTAAAQAPLVAASSNAHANGFQRYTALPKSFPRTPNLYDITQLIRRPASERSNVLAYFFNNISPQQLPALFGRGGIEGDFIETFLDAIIFVGQDFEHRAIDEFVDRSTQLLTGIASCDRFSIAKVFIDDKKVAEAFSVCNSIAQRYGGDAVGKVSEVERIWKSM
ncbi:hypothetical protein V1517DRAFT_320616 [Lipomyces orientalis]|uniref:Uncharacterized protein n=1 Tax=Lipomyces orientalis TaxID=1233043 RepID=A0ACC3TQF3_9ASCO